MIIIMKANASEEAVDKIKHLIESNGLQAHLSKGTEVTIVGVVGDKTKLQGTNIEMLEGVDKIVAVTETYKLVNKKISSGRFRHNHWKRKNRSGPSHHNGRSMCH